MSAGADPIRATFWLLEAPDSLSQQSHREPDGTGLGWFDEGGAPHLAKQAIAAYGDADFAREAREVSSRTFLAHIRFASTGALELRNTHPFEMEGRLFAHNGVIQGLGELERHLGKARAMVKGDTDSERFFALITREIASRDGDVGAGIEAACRWVASNLPLLAINFVLATSEDVWALRYPETHPLLLLEREPGEPLEHSSTLGTRVRSPQGSERPLVVIASEQMDSDPGWTPLGSGELIQITSSLEVRRRTILPEPPAHPLSLEQLEGGARASQS
jgi:glutamine amidotransferase